MSTAEHFAILPAAVVTEFYEAIASGDAERVRAVVTAHFADDVVLDLPASLPYGGRVEGARRLGRMFAFAATSDSRIGATGLTMVSIVDGGDRVAAHLTFDWYASETAAPVASSALELWTFVDGRVHSIDAYYRDTAQLMSAPVDPVTTEENR